MEKLEIHHVAPYLPYKLKAEILDYTSDYVGKKYDQIVGVHQWDKNGKYWSALTVGGSKPEIGRIKPILRPLSDLTKEIEHNGEKFIPSEYTSTDFSGLIQNPNDFGFGTYSMCSQLIEWHYDVFGLIEKGLAIDINTLDNGRG